MYKHHAGTIKAVMIVLTVLLLIPQACSQEKQLSPVAKQLKHIHSLLKADPDNRVLQQRYLQRFPSDVHAFTLLFDPADFSELYDGYQYIFALKQLMEQHPVQTACLLVNVTKDAQWKEDAFSYLQEVTAVFALEHTNIFAEVLNTFDPSEQEGVFSFLADGLHSQPKAYKGIIDQLQKCGEDSLAAKMLRIEIQRSKTHTED